MYNETMVMEDMQKFFDESEKRKKRLKIPVVFDNVTLNISSQGFQFPVPKKKQKLKKMVTSTKKQRKANDKNLF